MKRYGLYDKNIPRPLLKGWIVECHGCVLGGHVQLLKAENSFDLGNSKLELTARKMFNCDLASVNTNQIRDLLTFCRMRLLLC